MSSNPGGSGEDGPGHLARRRMGVLEPPDNLLELLPQYNDPGRMCSARSQAS